MVFLTATWVSGNQEMFMVTVCIILTMGGTDMKDNLLNFSKKEGELKNFKMVIDTKGITGQEKPKDMGNTHGLMDHFTKEDL